MLIRTGSGAEARIETTEIEALRATLRGPLLEPGDAGYEEARVVFNGMFADRRPALIVRCRGTADAVDAVRFARRHDLLTAVRGGGHHIAGKSLCDGGLLIDLSLMTAVHVDPRGRRARVEGGATWADVDRETQAFGLATPGGLVSHTGVAGLTLSGGKGWLRSKYGLSCDNLVSAEVVTAAGEVVTASAEENPDLFWALRGGGGNFGAVTHFEFRLHPVGPEVAVVFAFYPMSDARTVLRRWRDWVATVPEEVTSEVTALTTLPDLEALPPAVRDQPVVVASAVYAGDPAEGMKVLEPLRHFGEALGEVAAPLPFRGVQTAFDPNFPKTGEVLSYWKSHYLDELGDAAIDLMAELCEQRSSRWTMIFVQHLGPGLRKIAPGETAFSTREAPFVFDVNGNWRDPAETPRHVAWVREAWSRFAPHANGTVYLNYEGEEARDPEAQVRAAFGPSYERLVAIKTKYDPTNLFRLNQNIRPRAGRGESEAERARAAPARSSWQPQP